MLFNSDENSSLIKTSPHYGQSPDDMKFKVSPLFDTSVPLTRSAPAKPSLKPSVKQTQNFASVTKGLSHQSLLVQRLAPASTQESHFFQERRPTLESLASPIAGFGTPSMPYPGKPRLDHDDEESGSYQEIHLLPKQEFNEIDLSIDVWPLQFTPEEGKKLKKPPSKETDEDESSTHS